MGRGRLELPCSGRLVLSEVCLPIPPPARVQGGPRTRKTAALNRRRLPIAPPGQPGARGRTRTYAAKSYPLYVLIDKEGNVVDTQKGAGGEEALRQMLRKAGLKSE